MNRERGTNRQRQREKDRERYIFSNSSYHNWLTFPSPYHYLFPLSILGSFRAPATLLNASRDEKCYQCLRMYISAKEFYDKIISDKKAKDRKNRRAEQVMTQGSKLTQNMAVSILLGAISVSQTPLAKNTSNLSGSATAVTTSNTTFNSNDSTPRTFVLNIKAIDGVKYECERPHHDHFSPFALSDKTDRKDRNIIRRFSTDNSVLSDKLNPYLSTRSIKKAPNSAPDTVFSGKEKGEIFSNISHDLGGTSIISKDFNMTSCTDDTSVRTGGCDSCGSTLEIPLFGHVGDGEVNNNTLWLSVCMFVCLLVCTSATVFIPLCLSFYPSAFISAYCSSIFIHLSIDLSIYLYIHLSIHLSLRLLILTFYSYLLSYY